MFIKFLLIFNCAKCAEICGEKFATGSEVNIETRYHTLILQIDGNKINALEPTEEILKQHTMLKTLYDELQSNKACFSKLECDKISGGGSLNMQYVWFSTHTPNKLMEIHQKVINVDYALAEVAGLDLKVNKLDSNVFFINATNNQFTLSPYDNTWLKSITFHTNGSLPFSFAFTGNLDLNPPSTNGKFFIVCGTDVAKIKL